MVELNSDWLIITADVLSHRSGELLLQLLFFLRQYRQHMTRPADMQSIVYKIKTFVPSTREVIIDPIPSVGRAMTTAN